MGSNWVLGLGVCSAAWVAGCASGGDSEGGGISFVLTGPVSDLAEGQSATGISVVLSTGGGPLEGEVSVQVTDLLSGSASPGSDYVALGITTLVFPAGATTGDALAVPLATLGDDLVEGGVETIELVLTGASEGSASGGLQVRIADSDLATVQFETAQSGPSSETTGLHEVVVELDLGPAVSLGVPVTVQVADQGAGTATGGLDYAAFPSQAVSFPVGSADGAQQTIGLTIQDDGDGEPHETIVLALSSPGPGALLGSQAVHQVSIPDDDGGVASALGVSSGVSGVESTVPHDGVLDLGSGSSGSPASTQVRLSNQGVGPLSLSPPILSGPDAGDFHVELQLGGSAVAAMPSGATHDMYTPMVAGQHEPGLGTALTLDAFGLDELRALDDVRVFGFPLQGHGEVTLELRRLPSPIAEDATVSIDGVPIPGGLATLVGRVDLWRGEVLELAGSKVLLSLTDAGPIGFLELPGEAERFVHIDGGRAVLGGQQGTARIVSEHEYVAFGGTRPPAECESALVPPGGDPGSLDLPLVPSAELASSLAVSTCELAIETDFQLFQKFGSTQDTAAYVTQLIAAVSDQYVQDVHTSLSIVYLGIHTSAADPWTSQDGGGGAGDLLQEFRTAWAGSGWPVEADLAHFVSGASLGGGVAYVNVLCNSSYAFGVSGSIGGSIDWSTWTGDSGYFTWDFVVVAHELGHNFGASHTHDYCPPIDLCSSNCDGTMVCDQGTIMSYCHSCGGMDNIDLHFHPQVANIMRQRVKASCLDNASLAGGDHIQWTLSFEPQGGTGARAAELEFEHDADNQPKPFRFALAGQSQ